MGVHGLWRLIEPSGKPVPLETLENKILAVDVSIWLHQIVKGFQDSKGAPLPNAHLLGIYHRVCKLLYFRIKPVFIFDGGVPVLKKETIAKRHQQKSKTLSEADRIHRNLLSALLKHTAISKVLSEKTKAEITSSTSPTKKSQKEDDGLYVLPPSQSCDSTLSSEGESSSDETATSGRHYDLHSIDTKSAQFKALPVDVRHEILTDLKDTRKQSSWGRLHELPTESDDFSVYQMNRLLKRQSVQSALEETEKEMGGHSLSLGELEKLLKDQGVISNMKGSRIASDENTRFLLIKDIKQAVENAKKSSGLETIEEGEESQESVPRSTTEEESETSAETAEKNKGDVEFEDDLKKAIALSLEEAPSTSKEETPIKSKGKKRMPLSFLKNFEDADFYDSESSDEEESITIRLTPAQRYMMEYSGLTPNEIAKIIANQKGTVKKQLQENIKHSSARAEAESTETAIIVSEDELIDNEEENSIKTSQDNKISEPSSQKGFVDVEEKSQSAAVTSAPTKPAAQPNEECDKIADVQVEENININGETKLSESVEVMSDSESSCDDFLEVEEDLAEKPSAISAMEVVIKPEEELEDDLFKDIFANEKKTGITDESIEDVNEEATVITETFTADNEETMEKKSTSQSLKEKIEGIIKNYTKPKEAEASEKNKVSVEQLQEMQKNLEKEQSQLVGERSAKERLAGNITDQMYHEAQELLELFGVPYLTAPMEAEAQCAFLDLIDLTDGTITDDSDIWLFGGRTVYKNFFNQSKTVLEYKSENIYQHFKLSREQMILLAMLVGSDYTVGLTGVGPVTALEILAAFPPKKHLVSGLSEFKAWCNKGKLPAPGRTSLRGKLKNVSISENFPNPQIVNAYLEPHVETSKEKFSWGKPDVVGLIDFAKQKFGWTKIKTEEILSPVLKRLDDKHKQKTITDYYKYDFRIDSGETEKAMSKRVKTAINRIGKGLGEDEPEPKKKRAEKKVDGEDKPKVTKRAAKKKKDEQKVDEETKAKVPKRVGQKKKTVEVDEEIELLKQTEAMSKKRVEEIQKEVFKDVEEQKVKKVNLAALHKREVIPQKQKEKSDILRNKLKAIETFRKSKQGPGFVKKRGKVVKQPKEDAGYLSESSSSD